MVCKNCGTELPDNAAFCLECGSPVDAGEEKRTPIYCDVCETLITDGLDQCPVCGRKVADITVPTEETTVSAETYPASTEHRGPSFFDRMLDGIQSGVSSIAASSRTAMEKSKINGVINGLQNEKNRILWHIGEMVYNLYKTDVIKNTDELEEICRQVDDKNAEIQAQQTKLEALSAERFVSGGNVHCPYCGSENEAGSQFCGTCGKKMI